MACTKKVFVVLRIFCCTNRTMAPSLKLTAKPLKNGWLEDNPFLLGWPICRSYVSFKEGTFSNVVKIPQQNIVQCPKKRHDMETK